jgi:hypothetical protein
VSALRRSLLLIAVAVATLVGLTAAPAQAAFDDETTLSPLSVGTITVAAPTALSTKGTYCSTTYYSMYGNWYASSTLHAKLSWKPSTTTRGVTGYRVTAWFGDGSSYLIGDVGPTTTSVAQDVDQYYASQNIRVTVTTLTSYGWTAESAKSGVLTC